MMIIKSKVIYSQNYLLDLQLDILTEIKSLMKKKNIITDQKLPLVESLITRNLQRSQTKH